MADEQNTGSINDNGILALTHASGIIFGFIVPLIMFLVKTDASDYFKAQVKESLNFQITMAIAFIVSGVILTPLLIGLLTTPALAIVNLILCIMAALAVKDGKEYKYPFAIRLVK